MDKNRFKENEWYYVRRQALSHFVQSPPDELIIAIRTPTIADGVGAVQSPRLLTRNMTFSETLLILLTFLKYLNPGGDSLWAIVYSLAVTDHHLR